LACSFVRFAAQLAPLLDEAAELLLCDRVLTIAASSTCSGISTSLISAIAAKLGTDDAERAERTAKSLVGKLITYKYTLKIE
jgi:hypothetical protein